MTPTLADGIYATPDTLTLVAGGRIRTTAVAALYGWHITLGRTLKGTQRLYRRDGDGNRVPQTVARAPRCAWLSVPDRASAVKGLLYMAARLGYPLPGVA